MNSTNADRVNLRMHESVRAESCDPVINFRARANGRRNRIGIGIAEAPSGVDVFRLEITWHLNAWEQ